MKKILLSLLAIGLIGLAIGYYQWNKPKEDMTASRAEASLEAGAFVSEDNADENAANAKYLGKTIAVSGQVKEPTNEGGTVKVMLDTGQDFGVSIDHSIRDRKVKAAAAMRWWEKNKDNPLDGVCLEPVTAKP